ncbi:putative selenate ABC transporter substrate-binding protein [Pantanalinema rosaneae CENA516]|uniref:putative selenate ABC transporter substrate-binding protein n=1 Tax=Pantanalinema rosaneae TaxID=1620701 RepID=UPI003D6ECD03
MRRLRLFACLLVFLLPMTACSDEPEAVGRTSSTTINKSRPFTTGAIPDQDPEQLQRLYGKLAKYLQAELNVPVVYKPVTDYTAAVTAFRVGDLDMVWFGGLTGTQARLQVPGAEAIAQRNIDAQFHSVFIANTSSGIARLKNIKELSALKGRSFTFGSESSTSGRLMPQHFLKQAGVNLKDFRGEPGFSQSHDATLELVQAGTYEAGVMNEQVWNSRVAEGKVDTSRVQVIWRTPAYYDYHWVINPEVRNHYGSDFVDQVQAALLKLDPKVPDQKEILELFGAAKFIPTQNKNYVQIEQIGREIGKIK